MKNNLKIKEIDKTIKKLNEDVESEKKRNTDAKFEMDEITFFGPLVIAPGLGLGLAAVVVPLLLFGDPTMVSKLTSIPGILGIAASEAFGIAMSAMGIYSLFIRPGEVRKILAETDENINKYNEMIKEKEAEKEATLELVEEKDKSTNIKFQREEDKLNDLVNDYNDYLTKTEVLTMRRSLKPRKKRR